MESLKQSIDYELQSFETKIESKIDYKLQSFESKIDSIMESYQKAFQLFIQNELLQQESREGRRM